MANIFLSCKIVLYYKHLERKKMRHVYQRIKIQSFEKKKKESKKTQLNKNHDMNDTWILPGHVRAKTRVETFN